MLTKAKHSVPAYQRETVPFLGLNRSDDTREGEFSEQENISNRRYPFLAPRLPRHEEKLAGEADGMFCWDGHEIVARGGTLYLDGESVCNVTLGAKQFAVVNTKLVVWPDKITVDLTNRKVTRIDVQATNKGQVAITTSSVTFHYKTVYDETEGKISSNNVYDGAWAWTYGDVSWDSVNGWTLKDPQLVDLFSKDANGRYVVPPVTYYQQADHWSVGWPEIKFSVSRPSAEVFPEPVPGNDQGFYEKLFRGEFLSDFIASSQWAILRGEVYWAQQDNERFSSLFFVGDRVTVSLSGDGIESREMKDLEILGIDDTNNTLTFSPGTFICPTHYYYVTEDDDALNVYYGYYYEACVRNVKAGQYVLLNSTDKVCYLWDTETKEILATYVMERQDKQYTFHWEACKTPSDIVISRRIPQMEFVCEHENRLWGVSNVDKTIYASALGDPNNFFDYSGVDTDSYAVAVGSEGDFTGICSYGNAVLCWKERTLHKVLGDYPSNYQTATYRFSGVRDGAHKSLVNVNETLFFLGPDGVYAYTGNKPSLISRNLGTDVLKDGVGGTDGRAYYLSVRNGDAWELLSYDTHTGLWTRSDQTQVVDFCRVGDQVKFLAGDTVYTIGGGEESVEWEAVFVPMYETLEGGKQYNRLVFRVEVPKNGYLAADVRFDGGRWIQVGIVKGKNGPVHMPVPLRRCDKFQVRLRGKGDCAVLEMVREFRLRGDG